jgi:ribosome-binding factor A
VGTVRLERVSKLLKKEISAIINNELKARRFGFVTIPKVEVTADLRKAKVYFSTLGNSKDTSSTLEGLKSACSYIRKLIGKRLKLRYIPEFSFYVDKSMEYSIHISETIEKLKQNEKDY